jgi:hypothetical protein
LTQPEVIVTKRGKLETLLVIKGANSGHPFDAKRWLEHDASRGSLQAPNPGRGKSQYEDCRAHA